MTATETAQSAPLLMTKLYVPQVQTDLVFRSRVVQRLEEGLRRRLTLISAPAGFGKTTLVSSWYHNRSRDSISLAWYSLDERDNDTGRFLSYLVEAFNLANPDIGGDTGSLFSTPHVQPELVITRLINSFGLLSDQIVLVLDDYHVVGNPEIHEAVEFLIEHMPPQLHVVMTCRIDPPLSLARLRGRGEMIDIRVKDLRFTVEETEHFLQSEIGRDIGAEDVRELEKRTEGWVTGLQLAAISMRDREDVHSFIHSFSGQHHHIFDYLVDEVLDRQPPETQEFLLQTSLFNQFTADLCDAVTDRRDSHAILDSLVRSNMFIASLDVERRWFRYHHLFADLLRRKLRQVQPDAIPELRRRASVWFDEHGDPVETIWQSINGEDWRRVSDLVKEHENQLFNQGQSRTLLQMFQAVPNEVVLSSPWLLFTRSAAYDLNGESELCWHDLAALEDLIEGIEHDPDRAGELSETERQRLRTSLMRSRVFIAILENDFEAALRLSDEVLRYLPENAHDARALTKGIRAQTFWLNGDLQSAADGLREAVELSKLADAAARFVGLLGLASVEVEWGHLDQAAELYKELIDYAASKRLAEWQFTGRVLSFQSEVPYERNDLQEALEIAERGRELAANWVSNYAYDISYLHLARVQYALGDLDSVRSTLRQSPPYPGRGPGMGVVAQIEALQALIELESGERGKLAAIEADLTVPVSELLNQIWLWTPAVRTRGQVLNALGRFDDALSILEPLFEICIERSWTRQTVQTGAVLAISHQGRGNQSAAVRTFERALAAAEPRGFLRSILDAGSGIDRVIDAALSRRREEGLDTVYFNRLLDFARQERQCRQGKMTAPDQGLVDPLSERELEVLRLIAAGHTNAAIADELYVVVGTVKAHASSIYSKLGVRNRTQAVNRARELGLME